MLFSSPTAGVLGVLPHVAQLKNIATPYLNLTALTAAHGESTLECWQLATPFK
jgi:hypothetical protein